jgi:hypothetical protein
LFSVRGGEECTADRLHRHQSQRRRLARRVVNRRDETTDDVVHVEEPDKRLAPEEAYQLILKYGVALRDGGRVLVSDDSATGKRMLGSLLGVGVAGAIAIGGAGGTTAARPPVEIRGNAQKCRRQAMRRLPWSCSCECQML